MARRARRIDFGGDYLPPPSVTESHHTTTNGKERNEKETPVDEVIRNSIGRMSLPNHQSRSISRLCRVRGVVEDPDYGEDHEDHILTEDTGEIFIASLHGVDHEHGFAPQDMDALEDGTTEAERLGLLPEEGYTVFLPGREAESRDKDFLRTDDRRDRRIMRKLADELH